MIALLIFLVTLTLVIWQPRGLGIGWSASFGALLALLFGVVTLADLVTVWGIVWNATLAFIAIILISLLLDASGLFKWAALHITAKGRGSGHLLFVYLILLGALVSAFFANDGAALILTPIVIAILHALNFSKRSMLAFVMGAGFIADTASLPLVVSNLVNIVTADYFGISFERYASVMLPVNGVSILTTLTVLYLFYRRDIPRVYADKSIESPKSALIDPLTFKMGWGILALLMVGFFIAESFKIPISLIAIGGALLLILVARRSGIIDLNRVIRQAPWSIVIFSLGMYLVVYGLKNEGLTDYLSNILSDLSKQGLVIATLGTGFLIALLSSIMNNLPSVLIGALSIDQSSATGLIQEAMIYANVIGSDLGPKITPIGSLATLLWLHVLARYEIKISWGYYFKVGIVLTTPILLMTLLALTLRLTI